MPVIGITGAARSGKDTAAAMLEEQHGFVRISFAEPLRTFVAQLIGMSAAELVDSAAKEEPINWLGGVSPRQMMQTLGTEWGRNLVHPELWLKVAKRRVDAARAAGARGVVLSDVRFDNEAEMVRALGGKVVRIARASASAVSAHVSEQGVTAGLVDKQIDNDGTLVELARKCAGLAGINGCN